MNNYSSEWKVNSKKYLGFDNMDMYAVRRKTFDLGLKIGLGLKTGWSRAMSW